MGTSQAKRSRDGVVVTSAIPPATEVICARCGYINRMAEDTDPNGWRCGHCDRAELIRRHRVSVGPASDSLVAWLSIAAVVGGMFGGPVGMIAAIGIALGLRRIARWMQTRVTP